MKRTSTRVHFSIKTIFLQVLVVGLGFLPQFSSAQGCGCTNCPQFMPDNFVGDFLISVTGADNPTLGQNGQGVCGVTMNFDHEYIGDLSITLTSPSGQSVTLVGPIGFFGSTDGSVWDISFVPCNDFSFPDPGFDDIWNNNQAWGLNGNYSGAYYPNNGCLEDFNSGPVDGTWTLTVVDGQGNDVGNFYDYEIIFCDPSGISCFSCAAYAGNLLQPNITACEGSANLVLNLPPTYLAPLVAPDPSEYSYTYVIGGTGGVILAYETDPDLTSYDPGMYTVCGMSYLTVQEADIPAPNGLLTVAQLTTQLNGGTPPFCGDITGNCVNIIINSAPPDEEEYVEICAPSCHMFYNTPYCQSGTYVRTITTAQGCVYTATLYLTINQRSFRTLSEFICQDDCVTTPGFEGECGPGIYQLVIDNAAGCDSTITLTVQQIVVNAIVNANGDLNCNNPIVAVSGIGSTVGSGVSYLWTASNGGNIVGSAASLNAAVNASGDYQLRVCRGVAGVFCCDSNTVMVVDVSVPPAAPASISTLTDICLGDTLTVTAAAVPAATSYVWTVPAGVNILGNNQGNTIVAVWNSTASGAICVASRNNCGNSDTICTPINIQPTPSLNTLQGDTLLCAGTQATYSIPPANFATGYTWTVSGGTLVSGQNTTDIVVDWNMGGTGTVCAEATGICTNSPSICMSVTLDTIPPSPTLSGDTVACPGSVATYTVGIISGALQYNWVVTNGTILSGQGTDSLQVMWESNASSGSICAASANVCGASNAPCLTVILTTPMAGAVTAICNGTNTFYTISFPISGGTAPYSIPGGTITNGVFTSNPLESDGAYSFQITDQIGCQSPPLIGSFGCNCSTLAGQMDTTLLPACPNESVSGVYLGGEILDANDTSAFVLHTLPGSTLGTILAQNNTGVFTFLPGMQYGTLYYISHVAGNGLAGQPQLQDPCLDVSVGQPVIFYDNPTADAGTDVSNCGNSLTINGNIPAGSTGQWTTLANGANLTINNPAAPTTLVTSTAFGSYLLQWTLTQNSCLGMDTVAVQFNESPTLVSVVRVCDATNENFTVTLIIAGGTMPYSVNGQVFAGDTYVSPPLANGATYQFLVTDVNDCTMPMISGAFSCNCATGAGTMPAPILQLCAGESVTVLPNGDAVLDANDISAFVLHTGSGQALGQIIAQNTTGVFDFLPGQMQFGTSYYVSLVVGNPLGGFPDPLDPCFSVATGQGVRWLQIPSPQAGIDNNACGQTLDLQANTSAFSGTWTFVSGPGTATFSQVNSPNSSVLVSSFGVYAVRWTETNGICSAFDETVLAFNALPAVTVLTEICDGTNTLFQVSFTANQAASPYTVLGLNGSFTGNMFQSDNLPNNTSYSFVLVDANGCESPAITGTQNCDCSTDAGTMQGIPAVFCADLPAIATWNNDAVTDANDIVQFILHNGTGSSIGSILFATNNQPSFTFGAPLQYGVTYYISAIAGNDLNGQVDLNDLCLSVAPGTPVQWKPLPTAQISGDISLCAGNSTLLTFQGTGIFPLQVAYTDGTNPSNFTLIGPQTANLNVLPSVTTTYTLLSVSDGSLPTCTSQLNDAVTVVVNPTVSAGVANVAPTFCFGQGSLITLYNLLTGADAGGQWSEISSIPAQAGAFNAAAGTFQPNGPLAGTYRFRYRVTALAPCSDAETMVQVVIHPRPMADAGTDQELNCLDLDALLGGNNSSVGQYEWRLNGNTVGNDRQFTSTEPGTYTLIVSNTQGCTASDAAVVTEDTDVPTAIVTTDIPVRCYGESNGSVSVDSFTSAHPPVLFSLNGGVFVSNPVFAGLAPGEYVITMQDAKGCESVTSVLTVEEPDELSAELGPDIVLQLADSAHVSLQTNVNAPSLKSIVWQPLLDSASMGKPYQHFLPFNSWQLRVTVTNENGCTAQDDLRVLVQKPRKVFIANIFDPESNDPVLYVNSGRDAVLVESFQIFDRWGEALFLAKNHLPNDPNGGWDARFKGQKVQPGVYVYVARVRFIDGEVILYKGDVTVLR